MVQLRKKIMAAFLAAVILVSTGQGVLSESPDLDTPTSSDDTTQVDGDSTNDTGDIDSDGTDQTDGENGEEVQNTDDLPADITEEEALATTELMAENSNLAVYLSKQTGLIALKNKKNDYIWWSYPYNIDADPIANFMRKSELKSALIIKTFAADEFYSFSDSVNADGMSVEKIDDGFKIIYDFPGKDITVPVYFTLKDDYLDVEIPTDEIKEPDISNFEGTDSRPIISEIYLLMSFGAGSTDETGYMIVPDGSGAVIDFNNKKTDYVDYNGKVYGRDTNLALVRKPAKTQRINLPVLGIVKGENALMALIENGDQNANVRASISETKVKSSSYNMNWFSFTTRSRDSFFIGTRNEALWAEETGKISMEKIKTRYYPISDSSKDEVSYVDVALKYQEYLLNDLNVTKKENSTAPLSITLYGGTLLKRSIVGVPVNLETPATTYKEGKQILEELNGLGVDSMVVNYSEFNKAGMTSRIAKDMDISKELGGKGDFEELMDYANGNGIALFPEIEIQEYKLSGNGYSKTSSSAIRLSKSYATQIPFEMAYGTENVLRDSHTILSPAFYVDAIKKISDSFTKANVKNITLSNATTMAYSDFGTRNVSRGQAIKNLQESYQILKDKGISILAQGSNEYALPYVDFIQDVPMYSSNFDLFDYDIPFYQIALKGVIPMSSTSVNSSSDAFKHFLLSISTGTNLHYEFMKANPNDFATTEYEALYYAKYDGWKDIAANEYKLAKEILQPLANETIKDHKILSRNVIETTFSNGTVIKIDIENGNLVVNGKTIDFASYGLNYVKGAE